MTTDVAKIVLGYVEHNSFIYTVTVTKKQKIASTRYTVKTITDVTVFPNFQDAYRYSILNVVELVRLKDFVPVKKEGFFTEEISSNPTLLVEQLGILLVIHCNGKIGVNKISACDVSDKQLVLGNVKMLVTKTKYTMRIKKSNDVLSSLLNQYRPVPVHRGELDDAV